ncbi:MAG: zinc ribbon domain-containing protein [Deltaproteobacteria bacterium]|nr:zinc ribbon domain-containing protein [Deltaproteobacteria bacterium]
MPTYVYAVVLPDGSRGEHFEVIQRISEPALQEHPETGEPVVRVIQPVAFRTSTQSGTAALGGSGGGRPAVDRLTSDKGFTKYERTGDNTWTRTAGKEGPKQIHRPAEA